VGSKDHGPESADCHLSSSMVAFLHKGDMDLVGANNAWGAAAPSMTGSAQEHTQMPDLQ
jgi:hypothetical protein